MATAGSKKVIRKMAGSGSDDGTHLLSEIEVSKIDLVTAAANRMKFAVIKSDDGVGFEGSDKILEAAILLAKTNDDDRVSAAKDLLLTILEVTKVDIDEIAKSESSDDVSSHWMTQMKGLFEQMSSTLKSLNEKKGDEDNADYLKNLFKAEGGVEPKELVETVKAMSSALSEVGKMAGEIGELSKRLNSLSKRVGTIERIPVGKMGSTLESDGTQPDDDDDDLRGDLAAKAAKR